MAVTLDREADMFDQLHSRVALLILECFNTQNLEPRKAVMETIAWCRQFARDAVLLHTGARVELHTHCAQLHWGSA